LSGERPQNIIDIREGQAGFNNSSSLEPLDQNQTGQPPPEPQVEQVTEEDAKAAPPPRPITQEISPAPIEDIIAQKADQKIARIERDTGEKLTEDEKRIIYAKYFGENVSAIDKKTIELYDRYGHITKSTKLKRFLAGAAKVTGIGLLGAGLRASARVISPGFGFAGTVVGGVLGGIFGGIRGGQTEKQKVFGLNAWKAEYERIKNFPWKTDEEKKQARQNALAFLNEVLEKGKFRGNHKELLNMLAFYRREAAQEILDEFEELRENQYIGEAELREIIIANTKIKDLDDRVVEVFFNNLTENRAIAQQLIKGYQKNVSPAIRRAILKGALKGALIGGGIGLASDLIGIYLANARRAEAAYDYMYRHAGPGHELHIIVDNSVANPPDVTPSAELVSHGLNPHVTSYGNALSRAIEIGFEQGKLHFPPHLQIPPGQEHEAIQSLVRNFNFAQPLSEHAHVLRGETYDFNTDGLQRLIESAFRRSADGHVDLDNLASTIKNADSFLTQEFPKILAKEAAETGSQAASQGAVETIVHPIAVGAGAAIAGESAGKVPEGEAIKFEGVKSPSRQQPAAEDREQTRQTEEASQTSTGGAGTEATSASAETPPATPPPTSPPQEKRPPAENRGGINWGEILQKEGQEVLQDKANEVLGILKDKTWGELDESERENLVSLFRFFDGIRNRKIFIDAIGIGEYMGADLDDPNQKLINIKRPARGGGQPFLETINLADGKKHILSCEIKKIQPANTRNRNRNRKK